MKNFDGGFNGFEAGTAVEFRRNIDVESLQNQGEVGIVRIVEAVQIVGQLVDLPFVQRFLYPLSAESGAPVQILSFCDLTARQDPFLDYAQDDERDQTDQKMRFNVLRRPDIDRARLQFSLHRVELFLNLRQTVIFPDFAT